MTTSEDLQTALDAEALEALGERILDLPDAHSEWVMSLYRECIRARLSEAALLARSLDAESQAENLSDDLAQIVLDAAEWLKTLWEVGYMGCGHLPATPRTNFPQVEVEDVLNSALLARIRAGRRPLPFPPPTRQGVPWHEIVETEQSVPVQVQAIEDDGRIIAFCIEGDSGWDVLENLADEGFRLQHRGKGPLFRLEEPSADSWRLTRELPSLGRTIRRKSRGGIAHYVLIWPREDGSPREVPIRAASAERAESEAQYWVAREHPERYGQISFVHEDAT